MRDAARHPRLRLRPPSRGGDRRPRSIATAAAILALALSPVGVSAIELSAPIACPAGLVCPVQNLFDHDPGKTVRDFHCKALGYDGHDGVDFRVPSLAVQKAGVDVKAAADGVVVGTRDGMADVGLKEAGAEAFKGVECGNGVMIRHDDEWSTQYCHMAKGSIAVAKGETVARGQTIGRVGFSGMTEFPHLHFALRRNGKPVDPYAPDGPSPSCGEVRSAWAPDAATAVAIDAPLVLNAGFSDGPVPNDAIESGTVEQRKPGAQSPALVAYVRVIGLARGDGARLALLAPDGKELARNEVPAVDRPKAQWSLFTGRKRPADGWAPGRYRATVEILRGGKALKTSETTVEIGG